MGRVPLGKANKMSSVDAISALVLAGISCFVSAMTEEEEDLIEQSLGLEACRNSIESAVVKARVAVIKILSENNHIIEEHSKIIERLPDVTKQSPSFEKVNRERLRSLARIRLANDAISRAQEQMKRLPKDFQWLRVPMSPFDVPDASWLEEQLATLESKILDGATVYVYSHEGHGRCGVIAGCLLGRLYGLSANEALYRVQACHDCMHAELKRAQVVNCPQLPKQRDLVVEILNSTNRHFDGTIIRAVPDENGQPEAYLRAHVRGTPHGACSETTQKKLSTHIIGPLSAIALPNALLETSYHSVEALDSPKRPNFKLLREKREAL